MEYAKIYIKYDEWGEFCSYKPFMNINAWNVIINFAITLGLKKMKEMNGVRRKQNHRVSQKVITTKKKQVLTLMAKYSLWVLFWTWVTQYIFYQINF